MMMQVRNYLIETVWKSKNGFTAVIENNEGENATIEYSDITEKFYHVLGKKIKAPKYLQTELINLAQRKGIL